MSEKLISELEQVLIPYALDRFSLNNNPAAAMMSSNFLFQKVLGSALDRAQSYIESFVTWLCRAFVRSIVNVEDKIKLSEISTVILAEAVLMLDLPPYGITSSSNNDDKSDTKVMVETEVHRWFVFLQDQGKLPGTYNRFTGIYSLT
ncbi:MAG: hypothetical protein ACTSQE_15215 [Candidatus Heimdallarchaeaceae archaeon]